MSPCTLHVHRVRQLIHTSAQSADVLLLNEIGLDPGIDHCSAHSLLTRLREERKRVQSFTSFCGGLPAPDVVASTQGDEVPLGYKFSWSPRGVLSAALNDARFKLGGEVSVLLARAFIGVAFYTTLRNG